MTHLFKKSVAAISVIAVVLMVVAAPASAMDFEIHHNGADSHNDIRVRMDKAFNLNQTNNTRINNDVTVTNVTGNNDANRNTGGDVTIETGDADATVEITNEAGSNVASIDLCGCEEDLNVEIHHNGADSRNRVDLRADHEVNVDQTNRTHIDNDVDVTNVTGNNEASRNTGGSSYSYPSKKYGYDYDKDKNYDHKKYDHKKDYDHNKKYDHGSSYKKDSRYSDNHDYKKKPMKKYLWFKDYDWWKKYPKDKNYGYGGDRGGDVTITTGDATADVSIMNSASQNIFHN